MTSFNGIVFRISENLIETIFIFFLRTRTQGKDAFTVGIKLCKKKISRVSTCMKAK